MAFEFDQRDVALRCAERSSLKHCKISGGLVRERWRLMELRWEAPLSEVLMRLLGALWQVARLSKRSKAAELSDAFGGLSKTLRTGRNAKCNVRRKAVLY